MRLLMQFLARVEVCCGAADERGREAPCDADEEEGEDVVEYGRLVGGGGGGVGVHCPFFSLVFGFGFGDEGGVGDCGELEMIAGDVVELFERADKIKVMLA